MQIKLNPTPKNFTTTYVIKKVIATNSGPFQLQNDKVTNTELEMAEVLNYYFASVFTVEDTYEIHEITPAQPNLIPLSDCYFTEDAVTKVLDKINVNKIPGPDCTVPRILKQAKCQISKPFAILFNKSINSGSAQHFEIGQENNHN